MLKKLIALACLCAAFTTTGQETKPASRLGAASDILKIEKTTVKLSSYYEHFDRDDSAVDPDDYDWWTAFLTVKVETASVNGFSLAAELAAHMELYDDNQDMYDDDIEDQAKESLSLLYLQYKNDQVLARIGLIDSMGAHLDDNRYRGAIAKVKASDNLSFLVGAITAFAEIDYDDAEEMTYVTRNNGHDADDAVLFAEATAKVAKIATINPYTYYQKDYASVYGIDNKVTLGDEVKFGGIVNFHYINAETGADDTENYDLGIFTEMKAGDKTKLFVQVGNTKMGGDDANNNMIRPNWFKDYMYVTDQAFQYSQDARTYYAVVKVSSEIGGNKCWASAAYADIEVAQVPGTTITDAEGLEFQVGYNITKQLDINVRYFIYDLDDDAFDFEKVEARLRYKF